MMSALDVPLATRFPRAFVTGAAGFIGSHVTRALLDEGVHVTAWVLPGDPAVALAGLPLERRDGDLSDVDRLAAAMSGCDLVVHLAALYAIWHPQPERIWQVNVQGTRNALAAARRVGIKRFVHTSSIATIGYRGTEPATEDDPFDEWHGDDYVRSKYAAELEALAARDLDVVVVNPAFPFGAGDWAPTPTGKLVRDTLAGRLPFTTEGGFNVVDVRDVALGHLLAAAHGASGRRYILGGHNISYRDFAARIAHEAGLAPPASGGALHAPDVWSRLRRSARAARFTMPTPLLVAAGSAFEWLADHTGRPPLMTRRSAAYLAGKWRWVSTQRAESELGYKPRSIDAAIRASVAWFNGPR